MRKAAVGNEKKTFLSGVLLLTLSTLLVKITGLIYKIPMLSYLGSVGMGYFNSAYEIYALFCVIATAGLPVALSVLVADALARGDRGGAARIYRAAMLVFLLVGAGGSIAMWIFADAFCYLIKSEAAFLCIRSISPTLFFVCISSALRGYFQGHQNMLPTAVSQILESIGKLAFGLLFAHYALEKGYSTPEVAAFAGWGLTLSTALATGYLILKKVSFSKKQRWEAPPICFEKYSNIWKNLAKLAIPMTLGTSLISLTKLVDMAMILRRLQAIGYTEMAANEAYGSYTTLALSVFGLLPSLVNAVSMPLLPMLSAAIATDDRERQAGLIHSGYLLTSLFAIPASLGLSAYARPILLLLFGSDPAAVAIAAPLLSYLGISVFLSCMITSINSVLHAYREVNRPILSMVIGALIKMISAYLLIGIPEIALAGAPISTFLCNVTVVLLNLYFASKFAPMPSVMAVFVRPLLAASCSIGASLAFYLFMLTRVGEAGILTLLSILLTFLFYVLFSILFGVFQDERIGSFPILEKVKRFLHKFHLMPKNKS